MVSLFAAGCGASTPQAPPLVDVAPALSPDAPLPSAGAAPPAAPVAPNVYKTDLESWCNAPSAPGAAKASKEDRPRVMAVWISSQLHSDRAEELSKRLSTTEPAARKALFRKEIEGQGIKSCSFLDEIP